MNKDTQLFKKQISEIDEIIYNPAIKLSSNDIARQAKDVSKGWEADDMIWHVIIKPDSDMRLFGKHKLEPYTEKVYFWELLKSNDIKNKLKLLGILNKKTKIYKQE